MDSNRRLTQVYAYRVTAPNPGKYIIPPITLTSGGKRLLTDPLVFHVHPISSLQSLPTGISDHNVKVGWFPAKTTLYQGEVCPVVLKVYSPTLLRVASFGLPDPQKKNCLAWRFSLPNRHRTDTATLDGETHRVVRYTTTVSGIAPGQATLGPTKLRLIIRQRIIDPQVGPRLVETPIHLTLPAVNFDILALPSDSPPHFNGAVGDFQIHAQCQKTSLKETDSTEVILRVSGSGNLESIQPPTLTEDTWKIIDTSKITRGEERRFTSGMVTYRQLLRPKPNASSNTPSLTSTIPPYSFSYFNPKDKKYHTITTPAIPVNITPSPSTQTDQDSPPATPDKNTPPEEMEDILSFIGKPSIHTSQISHYQSPYWHFIPGAIALCLIGTALYQRHRQRQRLHPEIGEKKQALKQLAEATDTRTFYRRAGRIIDRWHHGGTTSQSQLEEVLAERDTLCFQPDDTPIEDLPSEKKKHIIDLLKRSTQLLIMLLCLMTIIPLHAETSPDTNLSSARDAWKSGQYQQAITLYQQAYPQPNQTPADILYNIGNCHHRLDQPGLAALAWRRALLTTPSHRQARQNLRFTELTQNALVPEHAPWQTILTITSPAIYRFVFITSVWIIVLATLALILFRKSKVSLSLTIILISLSALTAIASATAIRYFPDAQRFAPADKQAVVLEKTPVYKEAHRSSSHPTSDNQHTLSNLPPASLVRINAQRGPWSHITTTEGNEGWMETKHLGTVVATPE